MSLLIKLRNDDHYSVFVNPRMVTSITPRDHNRGSKVAAGDQTLYVQEEPHEVSVLCEAALAGEFPEVRR